MPWEGHQFMYLIRQHLQLSDDRRETLRGEAGGEGRGRNRFYMGAPTPASTDHAPCLEPGSAKTLKMPSSFREAQAEAERARVSQSENLIRDAQISVRDAHV